jgi:primosomal replication protein N
MEFRGTIESLLLRITKVDAYLDARSLHRNALFHQLLQVLIELASAGSEERALLESISNYLGVKGTTTGRQEHSRLGTIASNVCRDSYES